MLVTFENCLYERVFEERESLIKRITKIIARGKEHVYFTDA
jgi:hypothetical protein